MRQIKTSVWIVAVIAVGAVALIAQLPLSAPVNLVAPDGSMFVFREISLEPTSFPTFRATINNQSELEWDEVSLAVSVETECDNGGIKHIDFVTHIGDLKPGENKVSDTIGTARGMMRTDCKVRFLKIVFNKGSELSRQQTAQRKAQRERVDAELALAAKDYDEKAQLDKQRQSVCRDLYRATVDRKVSDLTVRESKLVDACSAVGYYHD